MRQTLHIPFNSKPDVESIDVLALLVGASTKVAKDAMDDAMEFVRESNMRIEAIATGAHGDKNIRKVIAQASTTKVQKGRGKAGTVRTAEQQKKMRDRQCQSPPFGGT